MAYIPNQLEDTGAFIPTTTIFDVSSISKIDVNSTEFRELFVRLYQSVNSIALVLNIKDTGFHLLDEFNTSSRLFSTTNNPETQRPIYRLIVNPGALGAGVTNTAHGLTIGATWSFIKIYGAASLYNANPALARYYPLPFADVAGGGANNIEVYATGTNVVINNNSGVAFTQSYIILEYVKS
jgi:hypothetical protein